MPRIYVLDGAEVGRVVEFEGSATLGRGEDCEVRLRGKSISRRHARIEPAEGTAGDEAWVLVDLGATNGVHVDGARVERADLEDGSEFLLGDLPLRFRAGVDLEVPLPVDASADAPVEPGEEIEIEDEILLDDIPAPPARSPTSAPAAASTRPDPPPSPAVDARTVDPRAVARQELLRDMDRSGRGSLLHGELGQMALPLRLLIYALVLALAAACAYGAFLLVRSMRGTL